jgi:hypothetical protein
MSSAWAPPPSRRATRSRATPRTWAGALVSEESTPGAPCPRSQRVWWGVMVMLMMGVLVCVGGSSGGSAAAVAGGMVHAALGSDTGGEWCRAEPSHLSSRGWPTCVSCTSVSAAPLVS